MLIPDVSPETMGKFVRLFFTEEKSQLLEVALVDAVRKANEAHRLSLETHATVARIEARLLASDIPAPSPPLVAEYFSTSGGPA